MKEGVPNAEKPLLKISVAGARNPLNFEFSWTAA
jgi:hypothetical protein